MAKKNQKIEATVRIDPALMQAVTAAQKQVAKLTKERIVNQLVDTQMQDVDELIEREVKKIVKVLFKDATFQKEMRDLVIDRFKEHIDNLTPYVGIE